MCVELAEEPAGSHGVHIVAGRSPPKACYILKSIPASSNALRWHEVRPSTSVFSPNRACLLGVLAEKKNIGESSGGWCQKFRTCFRAKKCGFGVHEVQKV